jgi:O-antigen/teichoic acid export membrane protein
VAVARNAVSLVIGQVLTTLLAIVLSAALGRSLGAADFGLYYLVMAVVTFAYVVVDWGPPYVVREVARRPADTGLLLGTTLALRVAFAAAACGLASLVVSLLGYDAWTVQLVAILMVTNLPLDLTQAFGLAFRGSERMAHDATVTVVGKLLTVAILVPALALGGRLLAVMLGWGLAGAGGLTAAVITYRRLRLPPLRVTGDMARELVRTGWPLLSMSVAVYGQGWIDAVLLSKLGSAAAVGWYAAARNFVGTLIMPATILGTASYPRLSRMAGDLERFRGEVRAALRPVMGLGALAAAGTWLFADLAVSLVYGRAAFAPAIEVLRLSAPVLFLFFVDVLLGAAIIAVGRPHRLAAAKAASVAVSTALGFLLIPLLQARNGNGGLGVVLASLGSELVMCGAAAAIVPRGTLDRRMAGDLLRALAAGAGTVAVGTLLEPAGPVVALPLSVAAFAALAMAVGLARRGDLEVLRAALRRAPPPPAAEV